MRTICLFAADYASAWDMHEALKRLLDLPVHYGHNADALHDCLAERREPVRLTVFGAGTPEVEEALRKCDAVLNDLGYPFSRLPA